MKNTQDLLHGNIRRELIALTIPLVPVSYTHLTLPTT